MGGFSISNIADKEVLYTYNDNVTIDIDNLKSNDVTFPSDIGEVEELAKFLYNKEVIDVPLYIKNKRDSYTDYSHLPIEKLVMNFHSALAHFALKDDSKEKSSVIFDTIVDKGDLPFVVSDSGVFKTSYDSCYTIDQINMVNSLLDKAYQFLSDYFEIVLVDPINRVNYVNVRLIDAKGGGKAIPDRTIEIRRDPFDNLNTLGSLLSHELFHCFQFAFGYCGGHSCAYEPNEWFWEAIPCWAELKVNQIFYQYDSRIKNAFTHFNIPISGIGYCAYPFWHYLLHKIEKKLAENQDQSFKLFLELYKKFSLLKVSDWETLITITNETIQRKIPSFDIGISYADYSIHRFKVNNIPCDKPFIIAPLYKLLMGQVRDNPIKRNGSISGTIKSICTQHYIIENTLINSSVKGLAIKPQKGIDMFRVDLIHTVNYHVIKETSINFDQQNAYYYVDFAQLTSTSPNDRYFLLITNTSVVKGEEFYEIEKLKTLST